MFSKFAVNMKQEKLPSSRWWSHLESCRGAYQTKQDHLWLCTMTFGKLW